MIPETINERQPARWTVETMAVPENAEPTDEADIESLANRYRAELKHQGVNEDIHHVSVGVTPRNIDVDHANWVPDEDWELGVEWDRIIPRRTDPTRFPQRRRS